MIYFLKDIAAPEYGIEIDPDSRQNTSKYFRYFLNELRIPHDCFKLAGRTWAFDEKGKALLLEVLISSRPRVETDKKRIYSDIRNGIFSAEYSKEYSWIIDCICSNSTSLAAIEKTKNPERLSEEKIRDRFWNVILEKTNYDLQVLPGFSALSDIIQTPKKESLISISALQDIIYIDRMIQDEFDSLYRKYVAAYQAEREAAGKRWQHIIHSIVQHRTAYGKRRKDEAQVASHNSLFEIIRRFPREPNYTEGKDFQHAKAREQEFQEYLKDMLVALSEAADVAKEIGLDYETEKTSSKDLFEMIVDENKHKTI